MATISELIKKELGIERAKISEEDKAKGVVSVGNLSFQQVIKIAKLKAGDMFTKDLKAAVKTVLGTANSLTGVLVEGKRPKEVIREIDEGKWDEVIK
ncbi:MAG: hypothetical protein QMD14_03305 [Candidatus Aenigmarchaeota archaeon]|nr:hypothetical protein [Candidatus Aenigmarchaeota archaeon]